MLNKVLLTAGLILLVTPALQAKSGAKSLAVSPTESKIEWVGSKKTGSKHNGVIGIESGSVSIEKDMIKSGEITINMASIEVLDIPKDDKNNAKLGGHLKSEDFFDIAKYPKAKIVIKSAKKLAEGQYEVTGDLTIKDTTQPVTLPVTLKMTDAQTEAQGKLTIDRTKFGIKYGSGNFFKLAADRIINDEFELSFTVIAK